MLFFINMMALKLKGKQQPSKDTVQCTDSETVNFLNIFAPLNA